MELNAALGIYMPSFFSITLNFDHHIENINEIPDNLKPTFYHEYFHYIQDLTTPFGFHFAWGNMSRVIQAVSYFQKTTEKNLELPIPEAERAKLLIEINLFRAINGDNTLVLKEDAQEIDPETLQLSSFSLVLRPEIEPFEPEPTTRFIRLILKDENDENHYYWLGAKAVIETMAEIIQEKHFGPTDSPRFPYRIVQEFINLIRPEINGRKDIMLVLCDLALQTNHPGFFLNDLLVNSTLRIAIPESASQVYDIGFDFFQEHKYNVLGTFQNYKNKLLTNINQLFGHQVFRGELEWLNLIIENGFQLRNDFPTFILDLYNAKDPFLDVFPEIIIRLGTPDIVNYSYDRTFALPVQLRGREEQIHPVLMTALFQFYKDLLNAEPRCSMIELCKTHAEMPVNDKCYNNQWDKINENEEQVCPLMAFYRAFGLERVLSTENENHN